ncbi:thymidylate kinase [Candidatus Woesearchaeota archaeon]|nr:thymidylate kinase [Candidatus Woesearchaeota archaeon]MBW3016237.1 thymidylate kinase [Candidatus Woesearchaeota archaeon]
MKGVFIVIEGTDGTGKATQSKKLAEYLQSKGKTVEIFDFPQYDRPSSFFVQEYLNGKYGSEVSPYKASLFYALDRFDASFRIREAINAGKIVISNRYVASNMGHQGGKIDDTKKRYDYFKWNDELEYGILGIPKPDLNIVLFVPAAIAQKLVDGKGDRNYIGGTKRDLHEQDLSHLKRAEQVYLEIVRMFPEQFCLIECMDGERLMTIDEVHAKVVEKVDSVIKG